MNCNPIIDVSRTETARIYLGVFNTFNARSQTFDVTAWQEKLGEGVLSINLLRPGDAIPYEVSDVAVNGTLVTWTFNETDTERSGYAKVFLVYVGEDFREASQDIVAYIADNSGPSSDTPPAPIENWYTKMLEASAAAQTAAQSAEASAEKAKTATQMFPKGGTKGQVLTKLSSEDFQADWQNPTGGSLPAGGAAGQYLRKNSSSEGDAAWATLPVYDGSYEVTPLVNADTIMQTRGTYLDRDVVLRAIPYQEVSNLSGGKTATIGGNENG